jgi:hypothetical protein
VARVNGVRRAEMITMSFGVCFRIACFPWAGVRIVGRGDLLCSLGGG